MTWTSEPHREVPEDRRDSGLFELGDLEWSC